LPEEKVSRFSELSQSSNLEVLVQGKTSNPLKWTKLISSERFVVLSFEFPILKVSSPYLAISIFSFFDIFSIIKIRNRSSEWSVPVLRVDFLSLNQNLLQFKFFWKDIRYK